MRRLPFRRRKFTARMQTRFSEEIIVSARTSRTPCLPSDGPPGNLTQVPIDPNRLRGDTIPPSPLLLAIVFSPPFPRLYSFQPPLLVLSFCPFYSHKVCTRWPSRLVQFRTLCQRLISHNPHSLDLDLESHSHVISTVFPASCPALFHINHPKWRKLCTSWPTWLVQISVRQQFVSLRWSILRTTTTF